MPRFSRSIHFVLILIVLSAFFLSSCSNAKDASPAYMRESRLMNDFDGLAIDNNAPLGSLKTAPAVMMEGEDFSNIGTADLEARKLIKRGSLNLRVKDLPSTERAIGELVNTAGGYLASTNTSYNSMSISIRVPQERFESTLEGLSTVGTEITRSQSTEDVTIRYHDLEGRLESKRQLRETFRGYLQTAQNIDEILAVETRLNDLENEIDSVGSQFRRLANLVEYATIDLTITLPADARKPQEEDLGERFYDLFSSFGRFLTSLLIVIVGIIIFGIPICIVLLLFWFLLFGRIGLMRKLFRAASVKRDAKI